MAKKSSYSEFRELAVAIKKGDIAPVYLLMGEEDYYIDRLAELLDETVVKKEEKDFNSMTFYGNDSEIAMIIGCCQQFPVMPGKQIVFLKEAQTLWNAKSQLDKLSSYVAKYNPQTVLVVTFKGDALSATTSLAKKINEIGGKVYKSEKLRDYQLAQPLTDYCSSKGIRLEEKALNLLIDYIGTSLVSLFSAIDKLLLATGGKIKTISSEEVEKNIGISKDFNTFELVKAISIRDYAKSMTIIEYFSRNPKQNPGVMVVSTLFNYFSKLFIASVLKDKSDSSIMAELDLKNSYALTDYRNGLRNYNARMAWGVIHAIREQDAKSKGIGSNQNEYELLKELIFKIFTLK